MTGSACPKSTLPYSHASKSSTPGFFHFLIKANSYEQS